MNSNIPLGRLFQSVTRELVKQQQSLNQADGYNQDHGDNMVQTFRTITQAVKQKQKQGASDSAAHGYAAKKLSKSNSASAQLYAQGLFRAAEQFQGKQVDERSGLQLLQTLIGGGQTPATSQQPAAGDMLGSLLGGLSGSADSASQPGGDMLGMLMVGLSGAGATQNQQNGPAAGGDMLSTLLGGLSGGGTGAGLQDGLDLGDLLNVGMSYMQFKQQGSSTVDALVKAFMQMSGMGKSADRTQSTELVVSSFLKALGAVQ